MKVMIGKVQNGRVVVDQSPLREGATVTVVVHDPDETFTLSAAEESALLDAVEEGKRGEHVTARQLLDELRTRR